MKKILFIATVPNFLTGFLQNDFEVLHKMNIEIHIATNLNVESKREFLPYLIKHHIDIERSPTKLDNLKAYRKLCQIIQDNDIDIIDCHTPVGGVLGRLIAKKTKIKCIYTAHGFHFYKGAPLLNWLIYYPIEKWMSRYTDILITINKEDYNRAKKKFKMKHLEYIPGVGVDIDKFKLEEFDRDEYRAKLGYTKDDFVILSVGELNKNKNHEVILRAISKLNNPKVKYMIAGKGILKDYLQDLAKELHIEKQFQLLGHRNDIVELNHSADIFAFPTIREGLGLAAIEAMAAGLPIITSDTRGINDYSIDGVTGFKCRYDDVDKFSKNIQIFINDRKKSIEFKEHNIRESKKYSIELVMSRMLCIYKIIEQEK